MTYKLNPEIRKIISPIIVVIAGKRITFSNGNELADAVFSRKYQIRSIKAISNMVEIEMVEAIVPSVNWIGEEQIDIGLRQSLIDKP